MRTPDSDRFEWGLIVPGVAARTLLVLVSASLVLAPSPVGAQGSVPTPARLPEITPGEVVAILAAPPSAGSLAPRSADPLALPELARGLGIPVRSARPVLDRSSGRRAFGGDAWVLVLEPGVEPGTAAATLASDPRVLYAGPNHLLAFEQTLPNDPLAANQYALFQSRAFEAWEISDGSGVLIAIVDSGVELDHPDLVNQIAINETEAEGLSGVDDDGNGYVDDIRGYDFTDVPGWPGAGDYLDRDPDPTDDLGHGTQVAGVAAAERNNDIGMAGMAPAARLLPVRAGFRTGIPFVGGLLQEDDAAAGILYAADRGARIINLSFGGSVDAPLIRHAVRYAQDRGALVVASAGNTGQDQAHYPSACPGVLVPGASNSQEIRPGFSTYGQDLDLLAPGLGLLATSLGGNYAGASGTSFSAPMVAGAAALVWSLHPEWSAEQVAWCVRRSSRRTAPGWTPAVGWGFLDAAAALAEDTPPAVIGVTAHAPTADRGVRLEGTVAHPDLLLWSLAASPDSDAVAFAGAGAIPGERVLATGMTRQAVAESLAHFRPGPEDAGFWVFRLEAHLRGNEVIEERSRVLVPSPAWSLADLSVELQAGAAGWSLAAWWDSDERYQAALRLTGAGIEDRRNHEVFLATHHGVRLADPLPAGDWTVEVLARGRESDDYSMIGATPVSVPAAERPQSAQVRGETIPGTPMPRTLDQDGDGAPEIFVESPPENSIYGLVRGLEFDGSVFSEWGNSEGLFRGIPVDAADLDGDGKLELVVFRLDRWEVWEASVVGGFPELEIHDDFAGRSLPSCFVTTPDGIRFLAVAGNEVQVLRSAPQNQYVLETEVATLGPNLNARALPGDFDADGTLEVAFIDQDGGVVMIELGATGPRLDHRLELPYPAAGTLGRHRGPSGDELLILERDPREPDLESDLERAATRLHRWRWTGSTFVETGSVAFAGMTPPSELQLLESTPNLCLRRGRAFDLVECAGDGSVRWLGRLHESPLPRVDGAVDVTAAGFPPRIFLGGTSPLAEGAESFALLSRTPAREGPPFAVLAATASGGQVQLSLGWDSADCGPATLLLREGTVLGSYGILPEGHRAEDVAAIGETVLYRLTSSACGERVLEVRDARIAPLTPVWDGNELRISFTTPLREDATPQVFFRVQGVLMAAAAVERIDEDHALLIAAPTVAADSIIVSGAVLASGIPLGGARRAAAALSPRPPTARPPTLAQVRYRPEEPSLELMLSGDPLSCDPSFRLDPGAVILTSEERGGTFLLDLPAPLTKGVYSLRLEGSCVAPTAEGVALSFAVGRLFYPNPVGPGKALVVENLDPGTRISILDLRGLEQLAWTVAAPVERRTLEALAPGLYLMRFEAPDGTSLGVEKLAVIR